jgi:hypothetical protein
MLTDPLVSAGRAWPWGSIPMHVWLRALRRTNSTVPCMPVERCFPLQVVHGRNWNLAQVVSFIQLDINQYCAQTEGLPRRCKPLPSASPLHLSQSASKILKCPPPLGVQPSWGIPSFLRACLAASESRLNAAVGPNMGDVALNRRLKCARFTFLF